MLHAAALSFAHPKTGQPMAFEQPPPPDFQALLETPQLGVAERSPVPSIENEHEPAMILEKIDG